MRRPARDVSSAVASPTFSPWAPAVARFSPYPRIAGISRCPFRADRACNPVGPQARCRQPPSSTAVDSRLRASGSSPVSARYATGIWRRRVTPSFCRRTSECAFAVRGEMPRRSPTSSLEHPAAMSSMTSRCRLVMVGSESCSALYIAAEAKAASPARPLAGRSISGIYTARRGRASRGRSSLRDRACLPRRAPARRAHRCAAAARTRRGGACASSPARRSRS